MSDLLISLTPLSFPDRYHPNDDFMINHLVNQPVSGSPELDFVAVA
jgi:hypothetical protein